MSNIFSLKDPEFSNYQFPKTWKAAIKNDIIFLDYYFRLQEICMNVFEWKNLPPSVDERFLELSLMEIGYCLYFNDEILGDLALTCMIGGPLDVYRIPIHRRAYASNGYQKECDNTNSVLIFNNRMHTPSIRTIIIYARILADIQRTIEVNVSAQKTPILLTGQEKELLSLKNIYRQYNGNEPVIYGTKGFSDNPIQAIRTEAPFVSKDLQQLKQDFWNEIMAYFGVESANTGKRERLITDEISAGLGPTYANRYTRLNERRAAAKKINAMFGTNIEVDFRADTGTIQAIQNREMDPEELLELGGDL